MRDFPLRAFLLVVALVIPGPVAAEPFTVSAEGVAGVSRGRMDVARDLALDDALRRAVEQVVGTMVESETLVRNLEVVSDKVYTQARGYVANYQVVSERQDGEIYRVSVKAVVDAGHLQSDLQALGLLYRRMGKPRVMVVIAERHAGAGASDPAGETEIIRLLIEKGFKVVDQAQVRNIRESDPVKRALGGDAESAQRLGRQYNAEVLVIGEAFSEGAMRGGMLGNLVSVRARLQAKAIRADTGEILASEGAISPGVDISEFAAGKKAVTASGKKWLDAALPVLLDRWSREIGGENSVQVVISGLSLPQVGAFKEVLLGQVRGVKDLHQRLYAADTATIDVDLKGTGQEMADDLTQKDFGTFTVQVTAMTPNRLDLRAVPK
jgi:Flagellar assembly protein T, N-terminal domain